MQEAGVRRRQKKRNGKKIVWLKLDREGKYEVEGRERSGKGRRRGMMLIKGKRVEKRWEREAKPHFVAACHGERITRIRIKTLGFEEMVRFYLFLLLAAISITTGEDSVQDLYERSYNDYPIDRRLQYLLETKRSISGIKSLIDELQSRLEKRTACALDGGLSASCNHKDAVEAGEHHRFLASSFAPGRRKRRSFQILDKRSQPDN